MDGTLTSPKDDEGISTERQVQQSEICSGNFIQENIMNNLNSIFPFDIFLQSDPSKCG